MKKRNRFRIILLISFAVIFAVVPGIGEAWAYFTTYARAEGGYTIHVEYEPPLADEGFVAGVKTVEITNPEGSDPVFVRVKALGGKYELEYSGDGYWTKGEGDDEWYYYSEILYGGETTKPLKITIVGFPKSEEDDFNVIVIYESTPVRYDEENNPYADWDAKQDVVESEGGDEK